MTQGCGSWAWQRGDLGEPAQLPVQFRDGRKAGVGGYLSALEIGDELPMLIETEGQLPATACHGKEPLRRPLHVYTPRVLMNNLG